MGLQDIFDAAGSAVDNAKKVADKASTSAYKKKNEISANITNSLKGNKKNTKKQQRASDKYDAAIEKLTNNTFEEVVTAPEEIELTDPNNEEELRQNYYTIDKNVFAFKEFKPEEKVGTEIKRWLETNFRQPVNDENVTVSTISQKRKNLDNQPFRLELGQYFKTKYDNNQLKFSVLNNEFNKEMQELNKGKKDISIESVRKLAILEDVINAYAGNEESMLALDDECQLSAKDPKMFSNIVRSYLEGHSSLEQCSQNLFFSLHGIDSQEMTQANLSDKEIVSFSVLKEINSGLNIQEFLDQSPSQLTMIMSTIKNGGYDFKNLDFTSQYYLVGNIDKIFKNQDMEEIPIRHNTEIVESLLFEYNEDNDTVDISQYKNNNVKLIASCDRNLDFNKGTLSELINIFKENDNIKQMVEENEFGTLEYKLDLEKQATKTEAELNPLSQDELKKIKEEESQALDDAIRRHGKPFGYDQ